MSNEKPQERQITASQAWIELMAEMVRPILYPDSVIAGRNYFQTSKKETLATCNRALQILQYFETMRSRIYVDRMIDLAEATTTRLQQIRDEYATTLPIRFTKRRRLLRQANDQLILQEAYQKALQVLVNTLPPSLSDLVVDSQADTKEPPPDQKNVDTLERLVGKETQTRNEMREARELEVSRTCTDCNGTGYESGDIPIRHDDAGLCPTCGGSGSVKGGSHA